MVLEIFSQGLLEEKKGFQKQTKYPPKGSTNSGKTVSWGKTPKNWTLLGIIVGAQKKIKTKMLKKTIQQKPTLKPAKLGSPEGQNLVLFLLPYIKWRKDEKILIDFGLHSLYVV